MRRFFLAVFLLAAVPSLAGSYDDFNQGVTALMEGKSKDTVIAAFNRAIAAGDLSPGLLPTAYFDRGAAYLQTHRCDLAHADFDMSLKLRPGAPEAVVDRGAASACLGRYPDAITDFTAAAAGNPTGWIYFDIGSVHWMMGDFTAASADLQKSLKLDPEQPYALLWLGISQLRDKNFDSRGFASYFSDMSVDDWPRSILQLFLGKMTVAELTAEAAKGDAKDVPGHKCEADFYGGEWQLTHGDVAAGKAMFQDAVNICPKNFDEIGPAQLELKRLQ